MDPKVKVDPELDPGDNPKLEPEFDLKLGPNEEVDPEVNPEEDGKAVSKAAPEIDSGKNLREDTAKEDVFLEKGGDTDKND